MRPPQASAWQIIRDAIQFSSHEFIPLLRSAYALLISVFFLETVSDHYFEYLSDVIARSGAEPGLLVFGTALLELICSLFFAALWFIAVVPRIEHLQRQTTSALPAEQSLRFSSQLRQHLNALVIEEIRVFAAVLRRLPFFLLPSLAEYLRLSLVPYVVLLDPGYEAGQTDALNKSRSLARRRWVLLGVMLWVTFVVPWIAKDLIQGDSHLALWENPARELFIVLFNFFWNTAAALVWYQLYRLLSADDSTETSVGARAC
jgi:hypothetical protein